jgi:hypothetical protein
MRKTITLLTFLLATSTLSFSQDRIIARGAEPGELYLTRLWYGTGATWGYPYYDTVRTALYQLTENGKKLSIQCDANYFANAEYVIKPNYILADATPGVLYNVQSYSKNSYSYTALWVSFDYGENWTFREEDIGSKSYYVANVEGLIYRHGIDGAYKSEDYGLNFSKVEIIAAGSEPGLLNGEAFSVGAYDSYQGRLLHTYNFYATYTEFPIDSQYVFGQMYGVFPDVYRGGKEGEVYVTSSFPEPEDQVTLKASFSADTGYTFRHVFVSETYDPSYIYTISPFFMSDREAGVFYIIRACYVDDTYPVGWHTKICIDYYRDYGETLEATFCHDITKDYEYEEFECDNTTSLESKIENQNSIQLKWSNSADNSLIRGYHIYRNNVRITNELLSDTVYFDDNLSNGDYEYFVKTYFKEGCVSDTSNHVEETIELGVKEFGDEIVVYPNPTTGELRITNYELGHRA